MNVAAVFSEEAYNTICTFLGSNWYAVAATLLLAAGFLIHITYSIILTLQNRKARGGDRYAVSVKPKTVEWSSQNMFVLGLVVLCLLGVHFSQFWYKMMFAELMGHHKVALGGSSVLTTDGAEFIKYYFSKLWIVALYLVWYAALWLHLTHGFWSAIHTIGWDNNVWLKRWQTISNVLATLICLGFAFVTLFFYVKSLQLF
jgi:succinate dehydrogenase / fumarate reductase cytochrome b subunit